MAEQSNQVARELKQLDAMELKPTSLNVRELRGRSVSEEFQTPPFRQPPEAQYTCMVQIQIQMLMVYASHHP